MKVFYYRSWFVRQGKTYALDHQDHDIAEAKAHAVRVARDEKAYYIDTKRILQEDYNTEGFILYAK